MQRNSHPLVWRPRGLSDTLDASDTFKGAMASLQNLIPDPTTANLWQCRPAALKKVDFAALGIAGAGFISALMIIGNYAYGMIASTRNAGKDEPFAYNLATSTLVAITGITNNNSPVSPATTGAWTPPTMALVGPRLLLTHPGFTGAAGVYFGWLDITDPLNPVWNGGNLTGAVTFNTVPSAVAQFSGRAYWAQNNVAQPSVVFSDILAGTTVTNANQILTFGDTVALTALAALPLQSQLGGIVQALMVFKGVANIYQITGDSATGNLAVNSLNVATGTLAPLSLCTTPKGLVFVSPEGARVIDFSAKVSDPVGADGKGVTVPFIFAVTPSRIVANCNGEVVRFSVQNGNAPGTPNQEYWFDITRGTWSGPHTFPASLIESYQNTFIMAPLGITGTLWQSDPVQSLTSTFVENGSAMQFNFECPLLPDTETMTQLCMTEGSIDVALPAGVVTFPVMALDQNGTVYDTVNVASSSTATQWGAFTWGAALWGGVANALAPRQLNWHRPLVFTRTQISMTGQCAQAVKIGALRLRYQMLGYLSSTGAAA